jgi:hypothetical protein
MHQDVQPTNFWLDGNQYPILLNVSLATGVVDLETGKITGGCPRYMSPRFYQFMGAANYGMDAHSCGVILYELTENKKAEPAQNEGESIEAAIEGDSLPEISAENPCGDLIRKMWSPGKGGDGVMKPAVDFFKVSLPPDVEQYSFSIYKGWLSC